MLKIKSKQFISNHFGAIIYLILLCFINIGVIKYTGFNHIIKTTIVTISFIGFYLIFNKLNLKNPTIIASKLKLNGEHLKYAQNILLLTCLTLFISDIYFLKGLPGLNIFSASTLSEITDIRSNIHKDSPSFAVYLSGFNMRGLFPFAILLLFASKQKLVFWIFTIIGAFYAFGLLQKSFIIFMVLPTIIYAFLNRKYLVSGLLFTLIIAVFTIIIVGSSDKIDDLDKDNQVETIQDMDDDRSLAYRIVLGMTDRIFVVPGEMVGLWFETIPSKKPFLYGDGYPLIPRLKGTSYVDYDLELYPILRPEYAEKGLSGSVNAATFMREYANFGILGLILSSLMVSAFLVYIRNIFKPNLRLFIAINLIYILMLSSVNLLTLLISGGWLVMILLYIIFQSKFTLNLQTKQL